MKKILACLAIASCITALLLAQRAPAASTGASPTAPALPDVVVNGFKEFKAGGYTAAIDSWAKDSSLLVDTQTLQALNTFFNQVANTSGTFQGADMIRIVSLSPNSEVAYTVARYERQLVFISFTCYKTGNQWIITNIDADKDPAKVLPEMMMSGQ